MFCSCFVFSLLHDNDLQKESFNSNFNCSFRTNIPSKIDKGKFVFQYTPTNTNGDEKASLADMDDMINSKNIDFNFGYF